MLNSHMYRKVSIGDIVRLRVIDWCRHGCPDCDGDGEIKGIGCFTCNGHGVLYTKPNEAGE